MRRREFLKAGFVAGMTVAGVSRTWAQPLANFGMTIVHVNDTHTYIEPLEITLSGKKTTIGGFARMVSLFDRYRATERNPLFLHAGDVFQGTLFFNQYRGIVDRTFMHRMGVRVMTIGNHEFDLGPEPFANFLNGARFPIVSANTDVSKEPKLAGKIKPYTTVSVGGESIGIVGLTTPDTAVIANPGPTVSFVDPVEPTQNAINELLSKGINKIIILSHLGYLADQALAKRIVGAQIIVGGHSHSLLGQFPFSEVKPEGPYPTVVKNPEGKDVVIVQSWWASQVVGRLRLEFNDKGELVKYEGTPTLLTPEIPAERYTADAIATYAIPLNALKSQVVAQAKVDLQGDRSIVRKRESNLSNLVADAMVWKTKNAGTVLALQNGGGVRVTVPTGPISVGKVYEVLPFGNTLVVMDLKGSEVVAALENGVSQWEQGAGRFLSGVTGLKYAFDLAKPVGQRVTKVEVVGKDGLYGPIDLEASYRTVVNNFIATGGDGFDSLKNAKGTRYDTGFVDAESFMDYLRSVGTVEPKVEGRITILNEPKSQVPGYAVVKTLVNV